MIFLISLIRARLFDATNEFIGRNIMVRHSHFKT